MVVHDMRRPQFLSKGFARSSSLLCTSVTCTCRRGLTSGKYHCSSHKMIWLIHAAALLPLNLTSGARFNWEKILLKISLKSCQKVKTKNSRNVKKSDVGTCLLFKLCFREDLQEGFFAIESGPRISGCRVHTLLAWKDTLPRLRSFSKHNTYALGSRSLELEFQLSLTRILVQ